MMLHPPFIGGLENTNLIASNNVGSVFVETNGKLFILSGRERWLFVVGRIRLLNLGGNK
jgi:hypothetical protein